MGHAEQMLPGRQDAEDVMKHLAPISALNVSAPINGRVLRSNNTNGLSAAPITRETGNTVSGGPGSGSRGCN